MEMERPVFHSKEERQNLALQRRLKEVSTRAEQQGNDTERRIGDHRNRRDREYEGDPEARKRSRLEKSAENEREIDLAALREHKLGSVKNPKTRVMKPSQKFRFSFDWDITDDTSRRTNSPYPHQAPILFGRGFLAGTDRREQKKLAAASSYDRHWTKKLLDEMTERDWRIFKEDFSISYKGTKVTHPMRSWAESNLGPELLLAIDRAGYKTPSPIQMAAIPLGLHHRDVIGVAETGSGKTAAFVLPMLNYIATLPPINAADGPYALILAPTRELAQQIEDETEKLAHYMGINVVSIVGGRSIENQGSKISKGCHVIVATPGRLLDCLERRYIVLNQCDYVVLDEADRMVDLGFELQLVSILDSIPSTNLLPENENEAIDKDKKKAHRTTYMFSATMPPGVERLARKYLRNPVVVSVGNAGKTADLIAQHVIMTRENEKMGRLKKLLDDNKKAIVFVNTKNVADHVGRCLDREGYRVTTVHSRKTQEQRETSLDGFRSKRYDVLVGTDVVGRGIDVPDVAHVINFDMAKTIEGYTHRIGRTGRAGKTGVATTFLTLGDVEVFYDLKQMLIQSNSFVPPELARHEASKFKPGSVRGL